MLFISAPTMKDTRLLQVNRIDAGQVWTLENEGEIKMLKVGDERYVKKSTGERV